MRKITKMIMAATLGLAIASAALVFNPVTTEAKTTYVTTKAAGKRIASLQKKAYKSKKKVSTSFKFKAKSAGSFERKAYKEACKAQFGKAYRADFRNTRIEYDGYCSNSFVASSYSCRNHWVDGCDFNAKRIKKGVYSCKITINGKNSSYRKQYRNDEARKVMINRITEITKGMNQFDKFYVTACWVECYAMYYAVPNKRLSDYDFMKGKYCGVCSDMADVLARYAKWAGVKNVGMVESRKDDHSWVYFEVDGTKYYFDPSSDGYPRVLNRKEALEALSYGDKMDYPNDWYKRNVDPDARDFSNPKEFWDSLTAEQKKAYDNGDFDDITLYRYNCDSVSKEQLLPAKLFKEWNGIEEKVSKWDHWRF